MGSSPQFRSDLYVDTAAYYDRFRVPYPADLVDDLARRAALSGTGRLLDLACGPGRLTFALCPHFAEVVPSTRRMGRSLTPKKWRQREEPTTSAG